MAVLRDLPGKILLEIFSSLLMKSIGVCRCVSKSWNRRLSTRNFIKIHLNRRDRNLLLINKSDHSLRLITAPICNDAVSKKVGLQTMLTWNRIIGSCKGLVLLVADNDALCVVNPITLNQFNVGSIPKSLREKGSLYKMYGFGYDSSSDDYKIVLVYGQFQGSECRIIRWVYVHSLKRRIWEKIDLSGYCHLGSLMPSGAYMNGAIHWFGIIRDQNFHSVTAAFDLAREEFVEIPAPAKICDWNRFKCFDLFVLGGCLCMVDCNSLLETNDIWVIKEYGLRESWTKFNVDKRDGVNEINPLCFTENGQEVLSATTGAVSHLIITWN